MRWLVSWLLLSASAASAAQLAVGAQHGVWLKADGTVWTWGYGEGAEPVDGLAGIRSVAAGDGFALALDGNGAVWSWGNNAEGELGNGTKQPAGDPARIAGLSGITAITVAGHHAMALDREGNVWTWGAVQNRSSQLRPVKVTEISGVTQIAAGPTHNIALDRADTVWVWGDHGAGDLGDNCYNCSGVPRKLPGLTDVAAVAGAYELTLALTRSGKVWAVGYGEAGQLGIGKAQTSTKPVMVPGLNGVKAIAGGYMHVLALTQDGAVWAWGSNHDHQIGNLRVSGDYALTPVRAGTLTGVTAIAAAAGHSAAVGADSAVWVWGSNDSGWLGLEEEALRRSDAPMKLGTEIPAECQVLFACLTAGGKVIRLCGEEQENPDKWTNIEYRFGPESGAPELRYRGPMYYFQEPHDRTREWMYWVRFVNGGYTYRVWSGERTGAGVTVEDAQGKRVSAIDCAERPYAFSEYLRLNLPCDPQRAGCKAKK